MALSINLYDAKRCHKTQHYKAYLEACKLDYTLLDVEENKANADVLRGLYKNRKPNFPTIMIEGKKLRNPSEPDLNKWKKRPK